MWRGGCNDECVVSGWMDGRVGGWMDFLCLSIKKNFYNSYTFSMVNFSTPPPPFFFLWNNIFGINKFTKDFLDLAQSHTSPAPQFESINSSALSLLYSPTLTSIHGYWKKNIALTLQTFVGQVMSLLFNTLSRFIRDQTSQS